MAHTTRGRRKSPSVLREEARAILAKLGQSLRETAIQRGIKLSELGGKLGISTASVSNVLNGQSSNFDYFLGIGKVLGVNFMARPAKRTPVESVPNNQEIDLAAIILLVTQLNNLVGEFNDAINGAKNGSKESKEGAGKSEAGCMRRKEVEVKEDEEEPEVNDLDDEEDFDDEEEENDLDDDDDNDDEDDEADEDEEEEEDFDDEEPPPPPKKRGRPKKSSDDFLD